MPSSGTCFFCEDVARCGYESNDQCLWLCEAHWRLIADFMVDELEEAGIIGSVVYEDD